MEGNVMVLYHLSLLFTPEKLQNEPKSDKVKVRKKLKKICSILQFVKVATRLVVFLTMQRKNGLRKRGLLQLGNSFQSSDNNQGNLLSYSHLFFRLYFFFTD